MKPLKLLVLPSLAVLAASLWGETVERVIARVNGDIITQSEFEARQLASVQAARIAPERIEGYLRENNVKILQEAIDDLLLVQRAGDLGIKLRPEYVEEIIEGIRKDNNIADDVELRRQLRREGMTLEDLKRNIARSVLRRQVLSRELEGKAQATEADARAYYESHKADYTVSAGVHLQEIEVKDEALARDLVRRARGGEDFEALARAHSVSPTAAAGGDLGRLTRADIHADLEKAIAALSAGGVSEPLKTEKGWRMVKVVAKDDARTTPFAEAREEILKKLNQDRATQAYETYMEGLRKASRETTKTMVSEVPLQVNLPAEGTSPVTGVVTPGAPGSLAPATAVPGIDASEISTSGQTRPERVAPAPPGAASSPAPAPAPSPSPKP
jgi:parvulin-like peptidyl-prolyl isomerase